MARCHLYLPLEDEKGNLFPFARVEIRNSSGGLIPDNLYTDPTTVVTVTNPVTLVPGIIDLYLDLPQRVDIIITRDTQSPIIYHGIDIDPPAEEIARSVSPLQILGAGSPGSALIFSGAGKAAFNVTGLGGHDHDGEGRLSTEVSDINTGTNHALSDDSTVVGQLSTAFQDSTVVGDGSGPAEATAAQSVIIGQGSTVDDLGVVIGQAASTTEQGSTHIAWPGSAAAGINEVVIGKNTGAGLSNQSTLVGSAQSVSTSTDTTRLGPGHGEGAGSSSVEIGAANSSIQVTQPGAISGSTAGIALGAPLSFLDVWGSAAVNRPVGLDQGVNDPTYHPAIAALQATSTVASGPFQAGGPTIAGWHPFGSLTSSLLGFYGGAGAVKVHVNDDSSIPAMTSLLNALSATGLIWEQNVPIISDSFHRPDAADVGYAETGHGSEWWADSGRNDAVSVASLLAIAPGTAPAPGALRVYGSRQSDVKVKGIFSYVSSAATPPQANAEYIGLLFRCAHTTGLNGYLAGQLALYKVTNYALTILGTYSTPPTSGQTLQIGGVGNNLTVSVNGSSVLAVTDATYTNQMKHGYALSGASTCSLFQVFPI